MRVRKQNQKQHGNRNYLYKAWTITHSDLKGSKTQISDMIDLVSFNGLK